MNACLAPNVTHGQFRHRFVPNILAVLLAMIVLPCATAQLTPDWATNYSSGSGWDVARIGEVDASGNLYVAGNALNGTNTQTVVLKYSSTGVLLWAQSFASGPGRNEVKGAALDRAGDFRIASEFEPLGGNTEIQVLKVRADGKLGWSMTPPAAASATLARDVTVDVAGNSYVLGTVLSSNWAVKLWKLDLAGNVQWATDFAGVPNANHAGQGLAIDSAAGTLYVTADIYSGSRIRYAFLKFKTNGVLEWARYSDGDDEAFKQGYFEVPRQVLLGGDAGIYFTGRWRQQPAVWKYDSSGTLVWHSRYTGTPVNINDFSHTAVVDLFGNVTWLGATLSVHFDRIGVQAWSARARWRGAAVAAIDSDFKPLVHAAIGDGVTQPNFVVTKFEDNGSRRWTYNVPMPDGSKGTAVGLLLTNGHALTVDTCQTVPAADGGITEILTASYTVPSFEGGPRIVAVTGNQAVWAGTNVTLAVEADGTGALRYAWMFSGFFGTHTNASLTLTNVGEANAGSYWVAVSDAEGTTVSAEIALDVMEPPTDQEAFVGGSSYFVVRPAKTVPQSFQWLFNGTPLVNETNSGLTIVNTQFTNAGIYTVRVVDAFGLTLEARANLFVAPQVPPQWTSYQPLIQDGCVGIAPDGPDGILVVTVRGAALFTTNGVLSRSVSRGDDVADFGVGANGSVYLYGAAYSAGPPGEDILLKYSPALTSAEWDQSSVLGWYAYTAGLAVSTSNNIYVGCNFRRTRTSSYYDYRVTRLSGTNSRTIVLETAEPYAEELLYALQADASGNLVALADHTRISPYSRSNFVVSTAANGIELWRKALSTCEVGRLWLLALDASGNIIAAGHPCSCRCDENPSNQTPHQGNYNIVKMDRAGNLLWSRRYYGNTNSLAEPAAIAIDADDFLITGGAGTARFDSSGAVQWVSSAKGQRISIVPGGSAYVAQTITNANCLRGIETCQLSTNGAILWKALFNRGADTEDILGGILATAGGVFVAGTSDGALILLRYIDGNTNIRVQLAPRTVRIPEGGVLTLTATHEDQEFGYRWFFNDQPLPAQTNQTLIIPNFNAESAGGYSVAIQNSMGAAQSAETWASRACRLTSQRASHQIVVTFSPDPWFLSELQASTNLALWTTVQPYQGSTGTMTVSIETTNNPGNLFRLRVTR